MYAIDQISPGSYIALLVGVIILGVLLYWLFKKRLN